LDCLSGSAGVRISTVTLRLPPDSELSRQLRRLNIRKLVLIALVLWIVLLFLGWVFFNVGGEVPGNGHGDPVGITG
jgi:ammonia channel protein AmtB